VDLLAVREGIAANLSTIGGLKVFAYEPDSIEPPSAIVGWPQAWAFHKNFHNALEGMEDLEIHILVGRAVDRPSQELLAKYLTSTGPLSIFAALESDKKLGGACGDSVVSVVDGFGSYTMNSIEYLGCKFHIRVYGG
jgi:hypothetical protein